MLKRFLVYGVVVLAVAWLAHIYVTSPLTIKKLPYRAQALWASLDMECDPKAPDALAGMLRRIALPYYALDSRVVWIDRSGRSFRCRVSPNESSDEPYRFRFASMTKVVTAIAILDLAEAGRIDLQARLLDFFPEVDLSEARDKRLRLVTLNHLLNHSSGFGGPFGSDNMAEKGETPWCPHDFQHMEEIRLAGTPGTNHVYSNVAYCLLGEVIQRVTDVGYRRYIRKHYLADYETLGFMDEHLLPQEPEYDLTNDIHFREDHVGWLDFQALSPATGLMGNPGEFAAMVWDLNRTHPGRLFDGPRVDNCKEKNRAGCYSYALLVQEAGDGKVGIQKGYLPGASSMLALNTENEVLVWTAAGAPEGAEHARKMKNAIVSFMSESR